MSGAREGGAGAAGRPARETAVAVVGMAGRYPGAATLDAWWENLCGGVDATGEVPAERWDWRGVFDPRPGTPGRSYSRWGGFLAGLDRWDAGFFDVAPAEAAGLDPQMRLFFEVAWETVESAGYAGRRSAGARAGVWVGCGGHDHHRHLRVRHGGGAQAGVGQTAAMANRFSTFMDWRGPSVVVDTLCSSSLVALHQAAQSLAWGECDLALAGGVHAGLGPEYYVAASATGSLSPTGRSRPFDAGADGYVPGEGAGAVLLKRLADAVADGDRILGVVRATAVNHGGRANRMFAMNLDAQTALVREALQRGGVHPETLGYVEAHAVGTRLGDAVEVAALTRVFREHTDRAGFCLLGSVKPQIGHLEAASGIAALHKGLLALHHGRVPPTLHVERVNPALRLADSPFVLADSPREWPAGDGPRRAALSAFATGGVNAHVVLEQAPAPAPRDADPLPVQVLTLSARGETALGELGRRLADALREEEVADFCYTAATGRAGLPSRLAVVGGSAEELAARLRDALDGRAGVPAAFAGTVPAAVPRVAFLFAGAAGDPEAAAEEVRRLVPLLERLGGADAPAAVRALAGGDAAADAVSLARDYARGVLWRALGIAPDAVLGTGPGALAAAALAGKVDAERLSELRASAAPGGGAGAPEGAAEPPRGAPALLSAASGEPLDDPLAEHGRGAVDPEAVAERLRARGIDLLVAAGADGSVRCIPCGEDGPVPAAAFPPGAWLPGLPAYLWSAGVPVDWEALYGGRGHRRIPIPTYPFQRERHWLDVDPLPAHPDAPADRGIPEPAPVRTADGPAPAPAEASPESRFLELLGGMVGRVAPGTVLPAADASFLEVGLDSAALTGVTQLVSAGLGVALSPILLFEHPTPARLLAHLRQEHAEACRGWLAGPAAAPAAGGGWTVERLTAALQRLDLRIQALEQAIDGAPAGAGDGTGRP